MHEQILEITVGVNRSLNPYNHPIKLYNHPVKLADQGSQKLSDLPVTS